MAHNGTVSRTDWYTLHGSWSSELLKSSWSTVIFGVVALAIATRLFTGILSPIQEINEDGAKPIPMVPYWLPILGHIPNMVFASTNLMKWARDSYRGGAFALNFGGTTHNFIFHPSLGTALINNRSGAADTDHVFKRIMCNVFGFPKSELGRYDTALDDISTCYKHLLSEPSLGTMVQKTIDVLKTTIPNLVTFSRSIVDQNEWERASNVKTIEVDGERVVEADFLPLIRDFVTFTANPALVGTDFVNNYPSFFSDLYTMDRGFMYLATGLPRWFPFPPLTTAHLARRRMFQALRSFAQAMEASKNNHDAGVEWHNLDDVSALIDSRTDMYRRYGFTIEARAAFECSLLWAMNANANPLIFWMLNHVYADKDLLAKLREEVAPYVHAIQPKQAFGIPEPPRLEAVDQEGLLAHCPLLKSCYIETLRVDTAIYGLRVMKKDFVLQGRDKTAEKFLLTKGSYAHVANDMHHKDPKYFKDAEKWQADRHVVYVDDREGEKWVSVEMGSIRPFGGGHNMCKGRAYAQKEVLVFAAAIISFWEIEAAGGGSWKMPRPQRATGTYSTNDKTKVWVKRRVLAEG